MDLAGLLGGLRPQCSATSAWGCPWHDAVQPYSRLGSGHGGKAERSAPLLLPASLRRKRKHLRLSWVDICGSGDRGNLCEKLGWHQRQGVLLSLYVCTSSSLTAGTGTCVEPHTRIRAACWLTGLQSSVLAHRDFTSCQQSLLIPQKRLFSLLLFHCSPRERCSV